MGTGSLPGSNRKTSIRTRPSYKVLQKVIEYKLVETSNVLRTIKYSGEKVMPEEFYNYLAGETPTGDTTTVLDILDNEYLMLHEAVEISELKKMGVLVNEKTAISAFPRVLEAHCTATETEVNYARLRKDKKWLKQRLQVAKIWLGDDTLPPYLAQRIKTIIGKASQYVGEDRIPSDSGSENHCF